MSTRAGFRWRTVIGLAIANCLPAAAQDGVTTGVIPVSPPATGSPTPSAVEPPSGIQEVIVTAQKRAQPLQEVPVSVGVVSGTALEDAGNFEPGALERSVANLQIDNDPQAPVIGIRGFYTDSDNAGFESAVGLVVDDLALGRPEFIPDGLFDVEQVEVLRGTQGTLFGKNTIAGVIQFITPEPGTDVSGNVAVTYGDPNQKRIEGEGDVPLFDGLSMRIAGVHWDQDGDVYNSTLNRDEGSLRQNAGRIKLLATPGEHWRISLSSQLSDTHSRYTPAQLDSATPAALSFAKRYDASAEDDGLDAHTTEDQAGYVHRGSNLGRLLIDDDLGDAWGQESVKLTTILGHAGYRIRSFYDLDASAADVVNTHYAANYSQDSLEFRPNGRSDSLFGIGGAVDWTTGAFVFSSKLRSQQDTLGGADLVSFALSDAGLETLSGLPADELGALLDLLPTLPPVPLDDSLRRGFRQKSDSQALFGQMSWNVVDRLSIIAGVRVEQDHKHADFDTASTGLGLIATVIGAKPFTARRRRKESDVAPKLGLQYQWLPDLNGFVTWSRGFKAGGFSASADTDQHLDFAPEKAKSWEAGVKSRWFDRTLVLDATVYRIDIRNLQVVNLTGTSFEVGNAGEARLQGLELESQWQPFGWSWLAVNTSLAYGEAKYRSYINAPAPVYDQQSQQDLSGRTLANAPNFSGSVSTVVTMPVGRDLALKLGLDVNYRSAQYLAVDLDRNTHQVGYALLGAHVLLSAPDHGGWSFGIQGNNLANERARDVTFDAAAFKGSYTTVQIPLRSVSATLGFAW